MQLVSAVLKLGCEELCYCLRLLFSGRYEKMAVDGVLVLYRLEPTLGTAPGAIEPGGAVVLSYSWLVGLTSKSDSFVVLSTSPEKVDLGSDKRCYTLLFSGRGRSRARGKCSKRRPKFPGNLPNPIFLPTNLLCFATARVNILVTAQSL